MYYNQNVSAPVPVPVQHTLVEPEQHRYRTVPGIGTYTPSASFAIYTLIVPEIILATFTFTFVILLQFEIDDGNIAPRVIIVTSVFCILWIMHGFLKMIF